MAKERLMKPKTGNGISAKEADMVVKAYKEGKLSKKQYDKLPPKLLLAIVKKKSK